MDYMKLVADLCQIIDRQNEITREMAEQLGQRDALQYEERIAAVRRDYAATMALVISFWRSMIWQRSATSFI